MTHAIKMVGVTETSLANSRLLLQVLMSSYSAAAGMNLRRIQNQNGLEAWRQLGIRSRSTSGQSAAATLETFVSLTVSGKLEDVETGLGRFLHFVSTLNSIRTRSARGLKSPAWSDGLLRNSWK